MRRLIAVAVLVAVIAAVCVVGQMVISECGRTIGPYLTEALRAAEEGDTQRVFDNAARAEEAFIEREAGLDFFIHHDLVEDLGSQLAKLKSLADGETLPEFRSETESALTMLTHVVNDERPTLLNVF